MACHFVMDVTEPAQRMQLGPKRTAPRRMGGEAAAGASLSHAQYGVAVV